MKRINFSILTVVVFLCSGLLAEPTLGILKKVHSNNSLQFIINSNQYTCKNYGIIMVGTISNVENTCKSRLVEYILNHPEIFHFSSLQLKRYQQYHLDIINNECIIYAKGRKSLSEILLENGLAVRDVKVKNIVYEYKFKRAELRAQREKKGIYSDPILRACVNVLK